MASNLQKEHAIVPGMEQLVLWGAPERDTTQNERPGMIGELLAAGVTFFSDNGDGFEVTEAGFGNAQRW